MERNTRKGLVPEIEKRRAVRALNTSSVADEVIQRILTAGTYAPSCQNRQPWRFLVQKDGEFLDQIKGHLAPGNYWAKQSQLVIAVCTRNDMDCQQNAGRDYAFFNTGMAVAHMLLQGVKEGLHTHPIAGFDALKVKEILSVPEDVVLLALLVFGYPGDPATLNEKHQESETSSRTRGPVEESAVFGSWPEIW